MQWNQGSANNEACLLSANSRHRNGLKGSRVKSGPVIVQQGMFSVHNLGGLWRVPSAASVCHFENDKPLFVCSQRIK